MKDHHPIGHKNMVSQDRCSLVTGLFTLKCRIFCKILVVLQGRCSFMAVVSRKVSLYTNNYFNCKDMAALFYILVFGTMQFCPKRAVWSSTDIMKYHRKDKKLKRIPCHELHSITTVKHILISHLSWKTTHSWHVIYSTVTKDPLSWETAFLLRMKSGLSRFKRFQDRFFCEPVQGSHWT